MRYIALAAALACSAATVVVTAQQVTKHEVPGIINFSQVETTVACAGATKPEALVEVRKMGFRSVINLRQASERNANIDAEEAAAKAAGLTFVHIPFNEADPDPMLVEKFLKAITETTNQPAFIHCASANRAAALWMVKRIVVDKWDVPRAEEEAAQLGLTKPSLKAFALAEAQKR
jgi:uncharacterized protein (TIGR01244 family)